LAVMSFGDGGAFGLLKIAWIVLAAVYLYDISVDTGQFDIMKESVAGITVDRRLQLLLVAFCFGAFIEGAAGFGAPVAIAGAFMIGLGFKPFHAAALNLIANTSPVAWGAIGTPVHTLAAVSGLPDSDLGRPVAAQRGEPRRPGRDRAEAGSRTVRFQLALGDRDRVLHRRDSRRLPPRRGPVPAGEDLLAHAQAHEAGDDRHFLHAGA